MMNGITANLREYWEERHLIPTGVWLLLITYSLIAFGSPMPPKITWLEIVMGCGLLFSGIALAGLVIRESRQQSLAKWCLGLTILLCLLPLPVGLIRGNALSNITRDIFPLLFLLVVPILLTYSVSSANRALMRTLITTALIFVGICCAVTVSVGEQKLFGSANQMISAMRGGFAQVLADRAVPVAGQASLEFDNPERMLFLKLYDPATLFASIFLSGWGVVLMARSWRECLPGMILAVMGALIAYEFMKLGLRAHAVLFVLSIATICLTQLRNRGLYIRLLPVIFVACVLLSSQIEAVLQLLWAKQQLVGSNGKLNEWLDVISTVFSSFQTALFGIGWGGVLVNSIYSNAPTRFTHSILSFYLLKTGTIGLGVLLTIIGMLFARLQKAGVSGTFDIPRLILLVSCIPPLIIGVLFEPTYKMLSYGVILALFALALPKFEKKTR